MFIWGRFALQHTITLWFSWIYSGTGKTGSTCDWVCLLIYRILSTLRSLSSHSPHTLAAAAPLLPNSTLTIQAENYWLYLSDHFFLFLICQEIVRWRFTHRLSWISRLAWLTWQPILARKSPGTYSAHVAHVAHVPFLSIRPPGAQFTFFTFLNKQEEEQKMSRYRRSKTGASLQQINKWCCHTKINWQSTKNRP